MVAEINSINQQLNLLNQLNQTKLKPDENGWNETKFRAIY